MSPKENPANDPNKGNDTDKTGTTGLSNNSTGETNNAGQPNSVTPKKGDKGDKEITLIELHYQQQLEKEKQEELKKKAAYDQCNAFQLNKAVKLDDENELVVDRDYLDSLDKPEFYASLSFDLPLEQRKSPCKARGFGKSSVYFQLIFQISYYEFPKSSLSSKIEKALDILAIFETVLPKDFYSFIEHKDYKTANVFNMTNLTRRIRGYIIITRLMGKYLLDKEEGYDRSPSMAFAEYHPMLNSLYNQMLEQDEKEKNSAAGTKQNPTQ